VPKCVIEYDPETGEYDVFEVTDTWPTVESGYAVVVDLKASHYKNIKRNEERFLKDQEFLEKFFIEAQQAGRPIRER
jgi:hypothetical protein